MIFRLGVKTVIQVHENAAPLVKNHHNIIHLLHYNTKVFANFLVISTIETRNSSFLV